MIKKIILWFLLIVLILLAVLSYIGYRSFNQEAFKNQIVENIQKVTGRTFSVNGPYALTWDPLPTMTLEQVTLSNIENSPNKTMFKADKVQIQIEWASLLKSPTRIKNIIVINPEVLIERISRSVTNLNFPQLFAPDDSVQTETMLGETKKQAQIDNIHIENGLIQYINQMTKQTVQLKQVTGEVAVGSLNGPFGFSGTATFINVPTQLNISLDKHDVSRPMNFLWDMTSIESDAKIKLDGQLFSQDPEKYLSGHASLDIKKPNVLLHQMGLPQIPTQNAKQTIGNCAFELAASKTTLSDMIIKLGMDEQDPAINMDINYTNNTKTAIIDVDISSLNLDNWKQTFLASIEQGLLKQIAQINFDINIANITWNGQNATTLHLVGDTNAHQIHLNDGSVLLPGSTTVQMQGLISADFNAPSGMAEIKLQSPNLPVALPFINIASAKLVEILNKAKKADVSMALEWSSQNKTLTMPTLTLDEITGTAHYEEQAGQQTEVIVQLDNVDLNRYLSIANEEPQTIKQMQDKVFQQLSTLSLPAQSVKWDVTLNNAKIQNMLLQSLIVNANTTNSTLNIETVIDTEKNSSLVMQAEIQNVGTPDWQVTNTDWELQGDNLPQLLYESGIKFDDKFIQNTRSFTYQGKVHGKPNAWTTSFAFQTPNGTLELNGQFANQQATDVAVHLQHASAPHLFVNLFDLNPFPKLTGQIDLQTQINQNNNMVTLSNLIINANNQTMVGEATLNTDNKELQTSLSAETIDIVKFLPDTANFYLTASGFDSNPFNFTLLKDVTGSIDLNAKNLVYQTSTYHNASLQLKLQNNTLLLDNFVASGANDASTIQAKGTLDFNQTPTLNMKIISQQLPITAAFGIFDGIGISGGFLTSEWNLSSFGETPLQMARSLSGNGKIDLQDATFIGADFALFSNIISQAQQRQETQQTFEPKLKHALTNGATAISELNGSFTIKDGIWQLINTTIKTPLMESTGASIDWDIPTTTIKAVAPFKLSDYPALPSFILNLIKDQRGVNYTSDITSFANALSEEFKQQKIAQEEAAAKAKQEQEKRELNEIKQTAVAAQKQLQNSIEFLDQQLNKNPNANIQNTVKTAQMTYQTLTDMMSNETLDRVQYQYITTQANKALSSLENAKKTLLTLQIQDIQKKSAELMPPVEDAILKLNEMYQKRPTISLLGDFLQNAEKQRGIMERAMAQFKKDLSYEQTIQVADIIQTAHDKIIKAYDYAEEIYSGRQSLPSANNIQRAEP